MRAVEADRGTTQTIVNVDSCLEIIKECRWAYLVSSDRKKTRASEM